MDGKTMGVGEINLELGDVKGKGLRQNPDEHKQEEQEKDQGDWERVASEVGAEPEGGVYGRETNVSRRKEWSPVSSAVGGPAGQGWRVTIGVGSFQELFQRNCLVKAC